MTILHLRRNCCLGLLMGVVVFGVAVGTATAADTKSKEKLDLNSASEQDLKDLPGVGEATAKKIVAGRPYKSVTGLSKAGVNEAEIAKLKSLVTVSETKTPEKKETKPADTAASKNGKMSGNGKASDNGKMKAGDKMSDSAKSSDSGKGSKMDAKSGKDAMAKSTDKSTDKMATSGSKTSGAKLSDSAKDAKKGKESEITVAPDAKEIKDATAKGLVWANLDSKVYHVKGDRWYGKTHHGKFMTEDEAKKEGYSKAHMNENSDQKKGSAK